MDAEHAVTHSGTQAFAKQSIGMLAIFYHFIKIMFRSELNKKLTLSCYEFILLSVTLEK
jgi:hypothetical protein